MSGGGQRKALGRLLRAVSERAAEGETPAAKTFWIAFEAIARKLTTLTDSEWRLRDYSRISAVLKRLLRQIDG
jgi:hypothetical protein